MTLQSRVLRLFPDARRLEAERNGLRGERDSMTLKVRATSAKMSIMEEEARVLRTERNRLKQELARQTGEAKRLGRELQAALVAAEKITRERDRLAEERAKLAAERDAALAKAASASQGPQEKTCPPSPTGDTAPA